MKKKVLVTLADAGYIDQAKQLFSSAYWNAGWDGDYLLLAHDVPEILLKWFIEKGIYVYSCDSVSREDPEDMYPVTVFSKFFLFKEYFKQWEKVVYMDADIIVADSLDGICDVDGFGAKPDFKTDLYYQINLCYDDERKNPAWMQRSVSRLKDRYDLSSPSFNSGVMVIDTRIISGSSFDELLGIMKEYREILYFGDQLALNLFMYRRWVPIEDYFNSFAVDARMAKLFFKHKAIMPVLHFIGSDKKPWRKNSPFYGMWMDDLSKADLMDLSKPPPRPTRRSPREVERSKKLLIEAEKPFIEISRHRYSIRELDILYGKNEMKRFRSLLLKELITRYSRWYNRFIPYFFVSYIPERPKDGIKRLLGRLGLLSKPERA